MRDRRLYREPRIHRLQVSSSGGSLAGDEYFRCRFGQAYLLHGDGANWFRFRNANGDVSAWAWGPYKPTGTDPDGGAAAGSGSGPNMGYARIALAEIDPDGELDNENVGAISLYDRALIWHAETPLELIDVTHTNGGSLTWTPRPIRKPRSGITTAKPSTQQTLDSVQPSLITSMPHDFRTASEQSNGTRFESDRRQLDLICRTMELASLSPSLRIVPHGRIVAGWVALSSSTGTTVITHTMTTSEIYDAIIDDCGITPTAVIGGPIQSTELVIFASGLSYAFAYAFGSVDAHLTSQGT